MKQGPGTKQPDIVQYLHHKTILDNATIDDSAKNSMTRKGEANGLHLQTNADANLFDISDKEEKETYIKLINDVSNRKKEVLFMTRCWDEKNSTMKIYVEWADYTVTKPTK